MWKFMFFSLNLKKLKKMKILQDDMWHVRDMIGLLTGQVGYE